MAGLSLPGVNAASQVDASGLVSAGIVPRTLPGESSAEPVGASAPPALGQAAGSDATLNATSASGEGTAPVADPMESPSSFTLYEVQEGDTVSSIAARYGLAPEYVLWNNPDLPDQDLLVVGQLIIVPSGEGILHEVRLGETLTDIAARYGVEVGNVLDSPYNAIASADEILESQMVFVPGGTITLPAAAEAEEALPAAEPVAEEVTEVPAPAAVAPATGPASAAGLVWPVSGPISSYYGPGHPLGIDIDMFSNPYAPVAAATGGTVTFAGGASGYSYGLYVVVVSPDGIETLYAHLSSIAVVQGQQVAQGQVIGNVGCTGYCTGNHLHFEVIDNGVRQNPLSYLP